MTTTDGTSDEVAEHRSRWTNGVTGLISYRYLGTFSEVRDRHAAEGWITIRRDLRGPVGLLAAPLGIAMLDTAGINVDPLAVVSPTRIDLQLLEPAADVARIHVHGVVLREGRSQFFTEARLTDDADPRRVVAIGSAHWSVAGPNPGFTYVDNRPGVPDGPDLPPLHEPFGGRWRDDGELEIAALGPELGREGLHQGPFQVVPEAAAMAAARRELGPDGWWIEQQGTSIVARGHGTPLVTRTEVVGRSATDLLVRVELRAQGAGDRLCSVTLCRFRSA